MDIPLLLSRYDLKNLTVGVLGGHSALDVCHGAKKAGFRTLVVAQKGREKTYEKYYRTRDGKGCVDETVVVDRFEQVVGEEVQWTLKDRNTIFVQNRYFWVYVPEYRKVEHEFEVPLLGSRSLLPLEERDRAFNQYHLLDLAGIRAPQIYESPKDIDRPVLVKAHEAKRGYERGFFVVRSPEEWESVGSQMEADGRIAPDWRKATIEEFIVGAPVNFNFFWSPLTGELELMGTDMRRQTNLDGLLRMPAWQQESIREHVDLSMVETGHVAVTVKESILEKAFDLGEKFVAATKKVPQGVDPTGKGILGPFALQGAVVSEKGKEDIVIFDVSLRIPGSPGTRATPYSGYLHGENLSMGERLAWELRRAVKEKRLEEVLT